MSKSKIVYLAMACTAVLGCSGNSGSGNVADMVVRHANIHTMDEKLPHATALAVKGDKILWVGEDAEAEKYIGEKTRVVDASGRLLLPGFIDSHFHVALGNDPNVERINANSLKEIQEQVRAFADKRPDLKWIEMDGWNYSSFSNGTLPTAKDLDGLTGGRPAFLVAYDYHTIWMNKEALKIFGITKETKSVSFAEDVQHDKKTGNPTGILVGFGSTGLSESAEAELSKILPSHSPANIPGNIAQLLQQAARAGITTVVDPQSYLESIPIYVQLKNEGKLPQRLQVALFHRRGTSDADIDRFAAAVKMYNDDRFRVSAVKLYIDDVIEPHTAAMLAPYADRPDTSGALDYPAEEFKQVVAKLDKRGLQIFTHATGDRGIRTALDAYEYAQKVNGVRDSRHEIVHDECLSAQDIPRYKALGVTACMQPRHCAPDITGQWAKATGPQRWKYAWAFRSLRDSGATLAFSSDWNVAEMEPEIGMYTALTRKGLDGMPPGGWIPEQTIDIETAVKGYTITGAWANFVEGNRGSLVPGKYADLVLLTDDVFTIPPDKLKDTKVVWTVVGGKEVYKANW
ncbi:MAG: amidohydrolase [Candidatus Acidiferrum sp.]